MSRDNQITAYVNDAEYAKIREWSNKTGKSISELVRQGVLEYTDHDRVSRIEDRLDEFESVVLDALADSGSHTHKQSASTKGSKTVERTRRIAQRIQQNHGTQFPNDDLERAIKDIAGGDSRTVAKYKDELKERGYFYEHPHGPLWYNEVEEWAEGVEAYASQTSDFEATVREIVEPYDVGVPDLKPHFGREWENPYSHLTEEESA
jgi:hypothetical protein